jgi:carbon storage regulator CsrA
MLYLVRKLNASIIINSNIEVKVIELQRHLVKLDIISSADFKILSKGEEADDASKQDMRTFLNFLDLEISKTNNPRTYRLAIAINASVIINDDIEMKISELKRNSVKIGIAFPKEVTILRKEVHDKITAL